MKTYAELLRDPRWQKKRLKIFERDNWQCTRCSESEYELHVHHMQYRRAALPWEYDDSELTTLCCHCHKTRHVFEKCPGIVVTWVYVFDTQKGPEEAVAWTGEIVERGNVDDEYVCVRSNGELAQISASSAMLYKRPPGLEPSDMDDWIRQCLIDTIQMDSGGQP